MEKKMKTYGQALAECVKAIMSEYDATTLYGLQRGAYKYTHFGPSVGFRLMDGTYIWNGDNRANDPKHVEDICIGSIVEGSDLEVPPHWLNLLKIADGSDRICEKYPDETVGQLAVRRWYDVLEEVNNEACTLWHYERVRKLKKALEDICIETTEDVVGLTRDEALNVITWVRARAEKALKQGV